LSNSQAEKCDQIVYVQTSV